MLNTRSVGLLTMLKRFLVVTILTHLSFCFGTNYGRSTESCNVEVVPIGKVVSLSGIRADSRFFLYLSRRAISEEGTMSFSVASTSIPI